jgi:hypothetical protein
MREIVAFEAVELQPLPPLAADCGCKADKNSACVRGAALCGTFNTKQVHCNHNRTVI